jgi:bifunctional non-homologous end joining protein LigD
LNRMPKRTAKRRHVRTVVSLPIPEARRAPFPGFIENSDPTLRDRPPSGHGWAFEIKIDGYRGQLQIDGKKVIVYSRSGHDWTAQFAPIAEAARALRARNAVIDGEVAVLGTTGLPDFQALRRELGKPNSKLLTFNAFDLLHLDGLDLRAAPYVARKAALKALLAEAPASITYLDYLEGDGAEIFGQACHMGLEGVVAKKLEASYASGRTERWIKLKCVKSDTFPIVAFVEKLGARPRRVASLYLGRREGDRLLYAGKARTGYTDAVAQDVRERLDPLILKASPLSVPVRKPKATWVEPAVLAEIEYSSMTDDGLLRAAVFKTLRDDLSLPRRHRRSIVSSGRSKDAVHGVPKENILQLLPDATAPSKVELADYWRDMWKHALPHLAHRPLKLVRHERGITFYHRGPLPPIPRGVHRLRVRKREGGEGVRLWIDDLSGLLGLVEIGAVELHPWNATIDDIERADRIVIDLDPGDGVRWEFMIDTALAMRDLLRADGLKSWPKATGGKGLHVMAPLEEKLTHDEARQYARHLAQNLARKDPRRYLLSSDPESRQQRIFLDYLRNGRGNTAIGAFSPRAREGFPIAAPVTWAQVMSGIRADAFTIHQPRRGARKSRVADSARN